MSRIPADVSLSVSNAIAVTPSDSTDIATTRAIYVGGAGNLSVKMADGNTVTFNGLAIGVVHGIQALRILATGTTATNILALY